MFPDYVLNLSYQSHHGYITFRKFNQSRVSLFWKMSLGKAKMDIVCRAGKPQLTFRFFITFFHFLRLSSFYANTFFRRCPRLKIKKGFFHRNVQFLQSTRTYTIYTILNVRKFTVIYFLSYIPKWFATGSKNKQATATRWLIRNGKW